MSKDPPFMKKYNILIADPLEQAAIDLLENKPHFRVKKAFGLDEKNLIQILSDCDAVVVRSSTQITKRVLEQTPNLKIILRAGVGLDNVDVTSARERGITVQNTPFSNRESTAEYAIALVFSLARQIPWAYNSMQEGLWAKNSISGLELTGKTLGIIGLGNIGSLVAQKAHALGLKTIAFDPYLEADAFKKFQTPSVHLERLLLESDIISLHAQNLEQQPILDQQAFRLMKKGVLIINTARGYLIDEAALLWALEEGIVARVALDVFTKEPLASDSPLRQHPKILCTPHLAASTSDAQKRGSLEAVQSIIHFFSTTFDSSASAH